MDPYTPFISAEKYIENRLHSLHDLLVFVLSSFKWGRKLLEKIDNRPVYGLLFIILTILTGATALLAEEGIQSLSCESFITYTTTLSVLLLSEYC